VAGENIIQRSPPSIPEQTSISGHNTQKSFTFFDFLSIMQSDFIVMMISHMTEGMQT
jgi:hypothetical protein